jgi:hypothetical protein
MIESLMGSLGGDNLGALMGMLGDGADAPSEEAAKGAIGTGVGAILEGLAKNASDPQGAESLFNAVTAKHDGAILDDVGSYLNQPDAVDGGKILGHVFGNNQAGVESQVANAAGIEPNMVSKLLPMLAPMVMGWLGKKVTSGSLNPAGLGGLLQDEKSSAESAMPDLGGLIGSVLGGSGGSSSGAGGLLSMLKNLFGGKR